MRVGVVLQARMSSSRFPGKVLKPLLGRPMLEVELERLRRARRLDTLTVATSVDASDNAIEAFCRSKGVPCFRGPLDDVLDRYYRAARSAELDVVARVTGDCPLSDPAIVDLVIDEFFNRGVDYCANTVPPDDSTFPDGTDVEVFSFAALERAWREAKKPSEREHVTFYFWQTTGLFKTSRVDWPEKLTDYRLTVDYPEDLDFVAAVLEELGKRGQSGSMTEIIALLKEKPSLREINKGKVRNAGWAPAFEKDRKAGFKP